MNKESKLNLNAGDYAISHCDSDKTYNGLEVHKMLCDAYIAGNNDTLDDEDEKIRNKLINLIKMSNEVGGFALHKWEADEMLTWLDKQGKKKASYTTIVETGDGGINALVTLPIEMKTAAESLGIDSDTYNKIVDECIFGEKKPTDKVEPKFNVGDWIVDKSGFTQQVLDFRGGIYTCTYNSFTTDCESNYHLWTIQDAKDGDVLAVSWYDNDNKWEKIIIFKKYHNKGVKGLYSMPCVEGYGNTFKNGKLAFVENVPYYSQTWTSTLTPATKEQRTELFLKMHEAGYEWDAYTKELKKIEQKPTNWSEEDEHRLNSCLNILQPKTFVGNTETINTKWLKSLKGRVQPQNRWKPSDEQISLLQAIINEPNNAASESCQVALKDILEQLKKLKEGKV